MMVLHVDSKTKQIVEVFEEILAAQGMSMVTYHHDNAVWAFWDRYVRAQWLDRFDTLFGQLEEPVSYGDLDGIASRVAPPDVEGDLLTNNTRVIVITDHATCADDSVLVFVMAGVDFGGEYGDFRKFHVRRFYPEDFVEGRPDLQNTYQIDPTLEAFAEAGYRPKYGDCRDVGYVFSTRGSPDKGVDFALMAMALFMFEVIETAVEEHGGGTDETF